MTSIRIQGTKATTKRFSEVLAWSHSIGEGLLDVTGTEVKVLRIYKDLMTYYFLDAAVCYRKSVLGLSIPALSLVDG